MSKATQTPEPLELIGLSSLVSNSSLNFGTADDDKCYGMTHYDILEVRTDATRSEIRLAYRRHMLELHPDRTHGYGSANDMIYKVTLAYWILSDDHRRGEYDRSCPELRRLTSRSQSNRLEILAASAIGDNIGLLFVCVVSPLVSFSVTAMFRQTALIASSLFLSYVIHWLATGVEGARRVTGNPQGSAFPSGFETRAMLFLVLYSGGWLALSPNPMDIGDAVVFSIIFAQAFADMVVGICFRYAVSEGKSGTRWYETFTASLFSAVLVIVQWLMYLGASSEAQVVNGLSSGLWIAVSFTLVSASMVLATAYAIRSAGQSQASRKI